jgi:hypothetical protein
MERFFQRYGAELTRDVLLELRALAIEAHMDGHGRKDPDHPEREHVRVGWRGNEIRVVWVPKERYIVTFLAPWHADHTF